MQVHTLVERARHDASRIALADAAAAAGAAPAPLENGTAAAAAAAGGASGGAPSTEGLSKSAKRRLKLKEKARLVKLGQQPVASEAAQTDEEAEAAEAADNGARAGAAAGGASGREPGGAGGVNGGVNGGPGGVNGGVNGGPGGARSRIDPRLHSYKQPPMPLEDPLAPLHFKVADLGNSCWVERQFTDDIQTRQYACLSAPDVCD
jgi:hypothetical protein